MDFNLLINKDFFTKKYNNFLQKKEDCGQYIWNELMLNITGIPFFQFYKQFEN